MLDMINLYYNHIINPLEKEYERLEAKLQSRKILDFLLRPTYKKHLNIYRQLICDKYKKLGEIISEECNFTDELIKKYSNLRQNDLTTTWPDEIYESTSKSSN